MSKFVIGDAVTVVRITEGAPVSYRNFLGKTGIVTRVGVEEEWYELDTTGQCEWWEEELEFSATEPIDIDGIESLI